MSMSNPETIRADKTYSVAETHYVGELATWDTFSGLIPCRVIGLYIDVFEIERVRIKITTHSHNVYKYGEVINVSSGRVYPRRLWKRSKRDPFRIMVRNYEWRKEDER